MKTIYVKQIGSIWTFCDEYGYCVHADGELAYHPDFFDKRPSGYPLYQEAAQHGVQADMACACPLDEFGLHQMPALPDGTCPTCRKPYR